MEVQLMKIGKRVVCIALSLCFLLAAPCGASALSDEEIPAPAALLMEADTGRVLYEKNAHEVRECASITKVMTLLLVMEAIDSGKISMTDTVTASEHASSMGGSDIWLAPGETMTVDEMVKATVVASANDAAVALAEFVSGTEEAFVAEMNKKAADLGMKETVFKNCNGLDEDGHVTSAYDVALMSRELIKHKQIFTYTSIWMDTLRGGKTQIVNTNKLLKSYKGITGLKTGTTGKAGSCISATAERDNLRLIAVTLGSATGKERFTAASTLLDYGFANYTVAIPSLPEEAIAPIPVVGGMQALVGTKATTPKSVLIPKGKETALETKVELSESVEAPVEQGQVVGKITYTLEGETLVECEITATEPVERISLFAVLGVLMRQLFLM
jgi:D-alanyl-D-alanine carboxypeptidase (penicillin-binding protein 5/6)